MPNTMSNGISIEIMMEAAEESGCTYKAKRNSFTIDGNLIKFVEVWNRMWWD